MMNHGSCPSEWPGGNGLNPRLGIRVCNEGLELCYGAMLWKYGLRICDYLFLFDKFKNNWAIVPAAPSYLRPCK